MIVTEKPLQGKMSLVAPDRSVAANSSERRGSAPYFWFAEVAAPAAGTGAAHLLRIDQDPLVTQPHHGAVRLGEPVQFGTRQLLVAQCEPPGERQKRVGRQEGGRVRDRPPRSRPARRPRGR